ncbi:MAG: hypothetical protein WC054_08745, partial [Candidatus Nanopelagicales bacterium]
VNYIRVQNLGKGPAVVEWVSTSPDGITLQPDLDRATLKPGGKASFNFAIEVAPSMAAGTYDALAQVKQLDVAKTNGGIVYAPAIASKFKVKVVGEKGTATLSSASEGDGQPVPGQFSIAMRQPDGSTIPVAESAAGVVEFESDLAVGSYTAEFAIPGLLSKQQDFEVVADETTDVTLTVTTVTFVGVAANEVTRADAVVGVKLLGAIRSQLPPVEGPVTISAQITRDGQPYDAVTIEQLPTLNSGLTNFEESYLPDDVLADGEYVFTYQLIAPKFTVTAAEQPVIVVSGSNSGLLLIFLIALLILIGGGVTWIVVRQRTRPSLPVDPPL